MHILFTELIVPFIESYLASHISSRSLLNSAYLIIPIS